METKIILAFKQSDILIRQYGAKDLTEKLLY